MIVIKRDDGTEYTIDASKSCVICGEGCLTIDGTPYHDFERIDSPYDHKAKVEND